VTEGGDRTVEVSASRAVSYNLTVNLTVTDAPNGNFISSLNEGSQTVTIASGATTADYTLSTEDDTTDEANGQIILAVNTGTGYNVHPYTIFAVTVNDNDATEVTLSTPDTIAREGNSTDKATVRLSLNRALHSSEVLEIPLAFSGGAVGTDFTLSLSGTPTGVALSGGTVTFTGSDSGSATVADILLSASDDADSVDETVTVSIPSSSSGAAPILAATNLGGGATGSRTGNGEIVLSEDARQAEFSLTGTPSLGQTLTISKTKDDPDGNGAFSYFWQFRATPSDSWSPPAARNRGCANDALTCTPVHTTTHPTIGGEFRVRVGYTDGIGQGHLVTTNTIGPITITPAAPTGLQAVAGPGANEVTLSWNNPNNTLITGYQVRQGAGSPLVWGAWTAISSSDKDTVRHTLSSLTAGTQYSFQLRAVVGS